MSRNSLYIEFWDNFTAAWPKYYKLIQDNPALNLERVLNLIILLAGDLSKDLDFELTYGQINRVALEDVKNLVELYISPKLVLNNVPIVNAMVMYAPKCPNLNIIKYRAYHLKDDVIAQIDHKMDTEDYHTFNYEDFGCQWFPGVDNTTVQNTAVPMQVNMRPIINLVILVRTNATKLLCRKPVTFVHPDGKEEVLDKWLPSKANVIDLLLINIIGEYNLIHNVGYIEFIPENDPLISPGSEFHELKDLRKAFEILNKSKNIRQCNVCDRYAWQTDLMRCTKCKKTMYCGKLCQKSDFNVHKLMCDSS